MDEARRLIGGTTTEIRGLANALPLALAGEA
jgi:hypothetical protein